MPTRPAPSGPSAARIAARAAARALLAVYGVSMVLAVGYFSFFASVEDGRVTSFADVLVALWGLGIGLAFLWSAARLDRQGRALRIAVAAVLAHVLFGLVKYFGYEERESIGFFLVDLLVLALLAAGFRRGAERVAAPPVAQAQP